MTIMTIQEVALRLGITRGTIQAMRKRGDFVPEVKLSPRRVGFREDDLDAWLAARTQPQMS